MAMARPREKAMHELLSRDVVDIYVGPENTRWTLHEKLLCYRSSFFARVFYKSNGRKDSAFGLPDEDDRSFKLFVGWLYAGVVPPAMEEKQLGPLLDLYLMGEKWNISRLKTDVLDVVRKYYHDANAWPSLRRVQYMYSNTDSDCAMRQLMVSCVARMFVLGEGMSEHWDNALRKNGQLAVDVILAVQKWRLEGKVLPDARDEPVEPLVVQVEEGVERMEAVDGLPGVDATEHELGKASETTGDETAVEDEA